MSLLLVVRDPEKILQACRSLNEMMRFEQSHLTGMTLSDRELLLGTWIDPTATILNLPEIFEVESGADNAIPLSNRCQMVNLFSLSGVWTICQLAFDSSNYITPEVQRELLLAVFFRYQQSAPMLGKDIIGSFMPVFEKGDSKSDIQTEIRRLQLLYPGMITDFLIYDPMSAVCWIEKQGDNSSHASR